VGEGASARYRSRGKKLGREEAKTMTTKLTLEDLEAMRQYYGIAQDLLEDLEQVGVLGEVGISLQRWAQLRDVPMEYALALQKYLDQQEANPKGPGAVGYRAR
jgi:hypothetical protein